MDIDNSFHVICGTYFLLTQLAAEVHTTDNDNVDAEEVEIFLSLAKHLHLRRIFCLMLFLKGTAA